MNSALRTIFFWLCAAQMFGFVIAETAAQTYPARPVRFVTGGVGGGVDFVARVTAAAVSSDFRQQVVVENRASGAVPGEIVARSSRDGYTLLVAGGTLWIGPLIRKTSYDPIKDFAPVSLTTSQPNILVVYPGLPAGSVAELIALAKSKPGALNYASSQTGAASHLAAELFKTMAKVDIVRVPYTSGATRIADLVGGQVQVMFSTASSVESLIKSGKLRALAVTSAQPSTLFPDLPTVASSGLPGYESVTTVGILAPAGTTTGIINTLSQTIAQAIRRSEVREKLQSSGVEAVGSTPAAFAALIKSEVAVLGKLIKDLGIRSVE